MDSRTGLNTCLFIRRQNKLIVPKRFSLPDSFVEIENPSGFYCKLWIARKYPAPMLPRTDGVFMEPTPDGAVADRGHEPGTASFVGHIGNAPSRKREITCAWQLARDGFYLNDYLWGEKPVGDPGGRVPPTRGDALQRIFSATY